MNLPVKFAFRYLFARKSYNVINLISGIGVAGMAVGTAALIIIFSVFNGFNELVADSLSHAKANLVVRPATGKVFVPDSTLLEELRADERVLRLSGVLEEQVFVSYEGRQSLARVRGLDETAQEESPLKQHIIDGEWSFGLGDVPYCIAGAGLSHSLGLNPRFVTPLEIFYPSRTQQVNMANPAASLRSAKARLAGVFSVNTDLDARLLLVPIGLIRELLEYDSELSSLDIWTKPGTEDALQEELSTKLGTSFRVLNRVQQDESLFRMMRYEKLAIYLILIFIVLLVAFNIYSSLRMLIIEKQEDAGTLRALGAPEAMVQRIFLWEGWLMSLLGMVIGLVLGVLVVWAQQRWGLVSMPGNFVVSAYPVVLKASDILWTVLGVAGIGFLMALIPSRRP
ncbi:MAG: ABC transporter permease [Bacteroidales bacterium]|nr:ABC transporter permease [Bacteroidales bacterium]